MRAIRVERGIEGYRHEDLRWGKGPCNQWTALVAERRFAASFARVGEAGAARLPRITLSAALSSISSSTFVLQNSSDPSLGGAASLFFPIFNAGQLEAQVELRTAEQKQAGATYAQTALKAFNEVESALASELSLAARERDYLAGLASERAGVETEGQASEEHHRCGFACGFDAVLVADAKMLRRVLGLSTRSLVPRYVGLFQTVGSDEELSHCNLVRFYELIRPTSCKLDGVLRELPWSFEFLVHRARSLPIQASAPGDQESSSDGNSRVS